MSCYNKLMRYTISFKDFYGEDMPPEIYNNVRRVTNLPNAIVLHMEGCCNYMIPFTRSMGVVEKIQSVAMDEVEKIQMNNDAETVKIPESPRFRKRDALGRFVKATS